MKNGEATLVFHDYKIDQIEFFARKDLGTIAAQFPVSSAKWKFDISFRFPLYAEALEQYFSGMEVEGRFQHQETETEITIAELKVGILGAFSFKTEDSPEMISQMLCSNCNAILLPYLRGAISQLVLNAGYGPANLPIINVIEAASSILLEDGRWPEPRIIRAESDQEYHAPQRQAES